MKNKKQRKLIFLLILILGLTIGFALLSTTLKINGVAGIKSNTWNIHWNDRSINVLEGSVEAETPVVSKTTSNNDTVSFDVELSLPGDFYEFEIDAINEGSIDGAINTISTLIYDSTDLEHPLTGDEIPEYLTYTVTYSDGTVPQDGDILEHGNSKTYKIRLEFNKNWEVLPGSEEEYIVRVTIPYVQYKSENVPNPDNFSTDSWKTIQKAVKEGDLTNYQVGDTKEVEIDLNNDKEVDTTVNLRIANLSTPQECSREDFSQTACGLVLEFVDSITIHEYNPDADTVEIGKGNVGGWEYSSIRRYVNTTVYNMLPQDLRNVILDTKVVSGHSNEDNDNFITTDRLYLLSCHEIWEDVDGNDNQGINPEDTAYNNTRQLDYYNSMGVTTSNISPAKKLYNGEYTPWWTRSTTYNRGWYQLYSVSKAGIYWPRASYQTYGVSPAFRIG